MLDPMDPRIPVESHDLARIYALEHLVSTLYLLVGSQMAERSGVGVLHMTNELRDGLLGSIAEGQVPAPFLALMRHHVAKVFEHTLASAAAAEELGRG